MSKCEPKSSNSIRASGSPAWKPITGKNRESHSQRIRSRKHPGQRPSSSGARRLQPSTTGTPGDPSARRAACPSSTDRRTNQHGYSTRLHSLRDKAIFLLMLHGGLHREKSSICGWKIIQYGRRRIIVRCADDHPKGVRTKSRVERLVDLHDPDTLQTLSAYVMQERPRGADNTFVFLVGGKGTRRNEPLSYSAVVKMFQRRCQQFEHSRPVGHSACAAPHSCHTNVGRRHARAGLTETTRPRFTGIHAPLHTGFRRHGRRRIPDRP